MTNETVARDDSKIREGIKNFLQSVSPYDTNNNRVYAVTGGCAVDVHLGKGVRKISDLDLLLLNGDDPEIFYSKARARTRDSATDGVSVDIFHPKYLFGPNASMASLKDYVKDACFEGQRTPVLSPEYITVAKLVSERINDGVLRDKDVNDILLLSSMRLDREKIINLLGAIPSLETSPINFYSIFEEGMELYRESKDKGFKALKFTRKIAQVLDHFKATKEKKYGMIVDYLCNADTGMASACMNNLISRLRAKVLSPTDLEAIFNEEISKGCVANAAK